MPVLEGIVDLGPDAALMVSGIDVSQLKTDTAPDTILEGFVQGALNSAGLVKDYETTISKGAAFGREFGGHSGILKLKGRIYYLGGHIVSVTGGGPVGGEVAAEWDRAANSLALLP